MDGLGNKDIMAKNILFYLEKTGKTQKEVAEIAGVAASTFNDWVKAKKYPRIDKIERMARYFGILKSDLIEDKTEMQKKNDTISDIVVRLRTDENFLSIMQKLKNLDGEQLKSIDMMLSTLLK